ncbi:MAG: DUF418 domain-containing protein [Sphingomicrobium sp.]
MATTEAAEPGERFATLDTVRGIAVMGILAMNIAAFAMPFPAYVNPAAYGGDSDANLASWFFSFVLIDGKMRGLFSILFGASTLLVIERATAAGRGGAAAHYVRMLILLGFGLVHFYFIWFGDILALYALCGMILYRFRNLSPRALVGWAIGFLTVSLIFFSLITVAAAAANSPDLPPGAQAGAADARKEVEKEVGANSPKIETDLALYRGPYAGIVEQRLVKETAYPFASVMSFGWETLGLMLIGMALFKSGFLTGAWAPTRYRKWAIVSFAVGVPPLILLALVQLRSGFDAVTVFGAFVSLSMPFDVLLATGWAALVILWVKRGGAPALKARVAAAGRMAFTNYLATSVIMTAVFYGWGLGLFGRLDRIELWLPVVGMWGLMLAWSKPWLDRHHYGPLEWLWRSLSRGSRQPMRRAAA